MENMAQRQKLHKFADIQMMIEACIKCQRDDGSLSTDHYLFVCNELVKMFKHLGKGLGLALRDIHKPIKSLEIRRVTQSYYNKLSLMLQFEAENNLTGMKGRLQSGTCALLIIQRSFDFMVRFLKQLQWALENDQTFTGLKRIKIYEDTMSRHQPKFVQAAVKMMLLKSPGRQELLRKLSSCYHGDKLAQDGFTELVQAVSPLNDRVNELFKKTMEKCEK